MAESCEGLILQTKQNIMKIRNLLALFLLLGLFSGCDKECTVVDPRDNHPQITDLLVEYQPFTDSLAVSRELDGLIIHFELSDDDLLNFFYLELKVDDGAFDAVLMQNYFMQVPDTGVGFSLGSLTRLVSRDGQEYVTQSGDILHFHIYAEDNNGNGTSKKFQITLF